MQPATTFFDSQIKKLSKTTTTKLYPQKKQGKSIRQKCIISLIILTLLLLYNAYFLIPIKTGQFIKLYKIRTSYKIK